MKSWNEIRKAATVFSKRWKGAYDEKSQAQSFLKEFFEIFGVDTVTQATFEHRVKFSDGSQGFVDCFWPSTILVEMKSKGKDLDAAFGQAMDYVRSMCDAGISVGTAPRAVRGGRGATALPRAIVVSDFQTFRFYDLTKDAQLTTFKLADLRKYVTLFGYMIGGESEEIREQDPVNRKAAEKKDDPNGFLDISSLCKVNVSQFYGIEIKEFPCEIAKVALWPMDHLCNLEVADRFGRYFARIPIKATPHIVCANALQVDWGTVMADAVANCRVGEGTDANPTVSKCVGEGADATKAAVSSARAPTNSSAGEFEAAAQAILDIRQRYLETDPACTLAILLQSRNDAARSPEGPPAPRRARGQGLRQEVRQRRGARRPPLRPLRCGGERMNMNYPRKVNIIEASL